MRYRYSDRLSMTSPRRLPADSRLRDAPEGSVGLALSRPISDRVDALVDLVESAGERTNRKELIAALILAAPPGADQLAATLRGYRQALVRDALLDPQHAGATVPVEAPRPGPRRRKP